MIAGDRYASSRQLKTGHLPVPCERVGAIISGDTRAVNFDLAPRLHRPAVSPLCLTEMGVEGGRNAAQQSSRIIGNGERIAVAFDDAV
jgi:hypothetical protein